MPRARYSPDESRRMIEGFVAHVIAHPNIVGVLDQVMSLVRLRAGTAACMVMGPTGVGKSTMVARLVAEIDKEAEASGRLGPGRMGHVLFSAPQATNGTFPVGEFLTRALLALWDPATLASVGRSPGPTSWRGHRSIGELQRSFESAVRERGPWPWSSTSPATSPRWAVASDWSR